LFGIREVASRGLDGEEGTDIGVAAEAAAPKIAIKLASVTQTEPTLIGSCIRIKEILKRGKEEWANAEYAAVPGTFM